MKGFQSPKRPTQKEIDAYKGIIRNRKDYQAANDYRDKLAQKYGASAADEIMASDPDLFCDYRAIMPPKLREELDRIILPKAQELMFAQFAEWGFEPGKDFSLGSKDGKQAMWIGERVQDRLVAYGFPIREEIEKFGSRVETPDPRLQLDEHLGVPFTSNLCAALTTLAANEDSKLTLVKVLFLDEGLSAANPQIEWADFLFENLVANLGKEWSEGLSAAYLSLKTFFAANPDAGDSDFCSLPPEGWWTEILARSLDLDLKYAQLEDGREDWVLGVEDCRKLHQVWRGERFTFLEVANALEKLQNENGKA